MENPTQEPATPPLPPATPPPPAPDMPPALVRRFERRHPAPPVPPIAFWKGFLDLTGGSLFFCLSALSIIYGITQIMGPLLLKPNVLNETLPCIGALNLYELALLGTLTFIVVWQKITDDAISLVVLIPLFLIGSGIALDTVANNGPLLALAIGAACAAVGGGKLAVLYKTIRVPFGRLALTGLTAVLIWNFLFGPTLVKILTDYPAMLASKRTFWLGSMLLLITTGLLVLIEIIRKPAPANDANTPFLRTPLMVLVFTMVLLGAAGAHLYALGYQFDIPFKTGDFILLATLGIVLFLEIMRPFEPGLKEFIAVMGCAPLVGTGIVLTNHAFSVPFQWGLEMLGHPSTIIVLGGLGMMRMALKSNWLPYWCITGVYGLSFLLTAFSPAAPTELNWRLCFGLVIIVAFAAGLILKRPGLCMTSVVLSGIGLGASDTFSQLLTGIGLSQPGGVLGYCGLGFIAVGIAFKDKTLLPMVIIGAAALTGTTFDFVGPTIGWRDFIALGVLLTTASLLWWRLRDYVTLAILTIPVVVRLWLLFRTLSTWRYVVLSFILLGIGAWISTLKNRKGK